MSGDQLRCRGTRLLAGDIGSINVDGELDNQAV